MKIIGKVPPLLLYALITLSTMTETVYSAALPEITARLGTQGGLTQLSSSVYFLGFAFGIFTLGRVSDLYGRRPVVFFGLFIYLIFTFGITFVTDIKSFIFLRFLQAYGASVGSVIAQAMARDSFKGWELSYIYASVAMVMAVVPSAGSAIGGYIIEYLTWHYEFYFLMTYAVMLFLLLLIFLPETNSNIGTARQNRFFVVVRVALKDRVLLSYAFMVGAYNGICFGFYIQAPFIFINNLGMSPAHYGKLFLIMTAANLFGSLVSKYLIKRYVSTFKIKILGLILSVIGSVALLTSGIIITEDMSKLHVVLLIFIPITTHLIGHSLIVPMLLRHALEDYHKVTGTAGAIFGSLYYTFTALVSFLISSFHSSNILNFSILFICLIFSCVLMFYYTTKWRVSAGKIEFH